MSILVSRARRRRAPVRVRIENLESRQLLATLTVVNAADSGAGSLRQAIIDGNSTPGASTIDFDILPPGAHTISLLTPLPALVNPTIIDGTTQPGYAANIGPLIQLDGANILDTTVTPPTPVPNVTGLTLTGGSSTVEGLTIVRFTGSGIIATRDGNTIAGDFIGTDVTGSSSLGNGGDGLVLVGRGNMVGGPIAGDRDVISGNTGEGLYIGSNGALPSNTLVEGNDIGTDATGKLDLGNSLAGIDVESSDNTIGGSMGEGNVIAFNGGAGVQVGSTPYVTGVTGNRIANNSIFSNVSLGIDLGRDGVTPINPYPHSQGPNLLQNYPTITSAYPGPTGGLTVEGNLHGNPDSTYTLEFHANVQADPSGYGQGLMPIGTSQVTTDALGYSTFTLTLASANSMPGEFITATATDSAGDTSEFSKAVSETSSARINLSLSATNPNPTTQVGLPQTYTFLVQNGGPSRATDVVFADTLPAGATGISAVSGQGTVAMSDGGITANIGTLASGASVYVSVTFTLMTPGTVTNTAFVTATQPNDTSQSTKVSQSIVVTPGAAVPLVLSGSADAFSVQAGQPLTYTFVVTNPSFSEATGVTFSDALPRGVVPVSVTPSQGTYQLVGNDLVVTLGTLPPGSTAAVTLVVEPTEPGFLSNFAMIHADQLNPNALNNQTTVVTYVTPAPSVDLAVAIQAAPTPATAGQLSAINLLVGNQGSAPASGVTLTDVLPTAAVVTGIHPSQGTYTLVGDVLTVNLGGLGVGAVASVTVDLVAGAPGFITDQATVFANETEQNIGNNFAQVAIPVVAPVAAPTIIAQKLIVSGNRITGVVLTFDEDMDPNSASMIANYEVLSLGQNSSLTATGPKVPIALATYNPVTRTTTITFKSGLNIGRFYKVVANGPGAPGLVDLAGNVLDGENNGLSNGIYQSIIARGTTKRPVQLQVGVPKPKPTPVAKSSATSAHKASAKHH